LGDCIEIATENSLQAFKAKNLYLSSYWEFRTYKAGRLPSISFQLSPMNYSRSITERYDYLQNIDVFRQQQSISSSGGLSVSQKVDLTGGTFTLNTGLNYLRSSGEQLYTQFSSTPVRLGYSQSLFGFNSFKWTKKIEPLKYEKAQKQFLYTREDIALTAVRNFFDLATAQSEYEMAEENLSSADSLYMAGKERSRISTLSPADLMTLELDLINAENSLENAAIHLQRSTNAFITYFSFDKDSQIKLFLPEKPCDMSITIEEALAYMRDFNPDILSYRQQMIESEQALERSKKTGGFDANVSASVGFNQSGSRLVDAYNNPSRQENVNISLSIPVVDWGIRKGQRLMAKNTHIATQLQIEQNEQNLELELIASVLEFNKQQNLLKRAEEAMNLAIASYSINKQRFIVGRVDINTVTLSLNRRKEARRNYLSILNNYWKCYYTIRKLTLFDFEKQESLSFQFEQLLK
jgi:outer membrane protein TolC